MMVGSSLHHVDQVLAAVDGLTETAEDGSVLRSWIRSANAHRLDPGSCKTPRLLTLREIEESRDAVAQLIEVSREEIDRLYAMVRPAHYVVLLCDQEGRVVEHRGEESEAGQFRDRGIWLGGVWSEAAEGTNGIGTALVEGRPLTVHRAQHFRTRHVDLSCSGAPIFGPDDALLGVLDVSSLDPDLSEHAHALTGALTIATARAIEERLFRKAHNRAWIVVVWPADDPASAALIAVDRDLRLVAADPSARRLFGVGGAKALEDGVYLWGLFERDEALFRHADRGDLTTELRPIGTGEAWPAIITPPQPTLARWSQASEEQLRLRPRRDSLALRQAPTPEPARGGLPPRTLQRVREYIDTHLDQNIDLETLAATAGLSVFHFARSFRRSDGTTPHAYILERRIAKARELLAEAELPLSEIALKVGFADQSHFARRFRRSVGTSPGEFRKLSRRSAIG